ncbi:MAG: hypothetical protein E6G97_24255 [Alphaproteobacteria bacterium]|nr:MAG: hypothetical protein E6G97_24255 [Alphaproteobacteria bacterium]
MTFAFDTLPNARYLRERGVVQEQAEAQAEAARQFIMAELVSKTDLQTALTHVHAKLDNLGLRLTVHLGVLLAAGIALLGAVIKPA